MVLLDAGYQEERFVFCDIARERMEEAKTRDPSAIYLPPLDFPRGSARPAWAKCGQPAAVDFT